jgi:hypothetical protein
MEGVEKKEKMFAQGVERKPGLCLSLSRVLFLSLSLRYFCFVKNTHTQGMSSTERPDNQQKALFRFPRPPFSPKKYRVSLKYIHNKIFSLSLRLAITTHTGTGRETKALIHFSAI